MVQPLLTGSGQTEFVLCEQTIMLINNHIVPRKGDIPIKELNLTRIEKLYQEMIEAGAGIRTVR